MRTSTYKNIKLAFYYYKNKIFKLPVSTALILPVSKASFLIKNSWSSSVIFCLTIKNKINGRVKHTSKDIILICKLKVSQAFDCKIIVELTVKAPTL